VAAEKDLARIKVAVARKRDPLCGIAAIALGLGEVLKTYKMKKHFALEITHAAFGFTRKTAAIAAEATTAGLYVARTSLSEATLDEAATVRNYKSLALVGRPFRCTKTVDLHVRPVYHWLPDRVWAHLFLCMLACYPIPTADRSAEVVHLTADEERRLRNMLAGFRERGSS
jgi:hypothetical protein